MNVAHKAVFCSICHFPASVILEKILVVPYLVDGEDVLIAIGFAKSFSAFTVPWKGLMSRKYDAPFFQ
jgi:hypothetical protein